MFSQQNLRTIHVLDKKGKEINSYHIDSKDTLQFDKKIVFVIDSLTNTGFLNLNSYFDENDNLLINQGTKYKWINICLDDDTRLLLSKLKIDISKWEGKYILPTRVKVEFEKLLTYFDNTGYPFAYVKMDSITFENDSMISGLFVIQKNKRIYFDSIKITSGIDLSTGFLRRFLEIKKGETFDKSKIDKVSEKLNNLPFVTLNNPPTVSFFGSGATLNLDLKEKKVNRFDFLLGLLPDNTGVRKYRLTGEITAEFLNKFGHGERLYFNYKNMAKERQNLILNVNYPFIFEMPFGLDSKFSIFINQDQYRDVNLDLGIQYFFNGVNYVKSYWKLFSSRLLSIDSTSILALGRLPGKLDIMSNSLGIQLGYENLDYHYNPRKGFELVIDGYSGQRKILKNFQITSLKNENFDFSNSYDSIKTSSYVFNISESFSFYYSLGPKIVLKLANKSAWKKSAEKLYENELFRLGGSGLLRGFDEESIFASIYSVSTAEIRLLIDRNSFLFAFLDYAFIYNPYSTISIEDTPVGFGAGINFDTKGGILSLASAVGKQYDNPFDFKDVKIHIGYISLF